MNKEKNFISAVIYVHNDETHIGRLLQNVIGVLEENFEHSEVICVNDHSTDGSVAAIKEISKAAATTTVTVLNMSFFHGVESAMGAGVDLAIGDFVLEFDSALQDFSREEIMKVYRKSLEGYDIVSAVPGQKQRLSSGLFYHLFSQYSGVSEQLHTERFRILSRRVINRIDSMNKSIPYRKAVYANCGLRATILSYPVEEGAVKGKEDKKEKAYRRNLAMDTLILFTDVGYRFAVSMTILMMSLAIFMAVYCAVVYLSSHPIAGWTTTVLFLSAGFFGLFGILTIIIKYLQILVNLVFKRKQYSFESIEKLT
ncbi:MAG: glycosyltransferase [Lachnospiraceae bacterium]|nr:glycosyltransferase [Lachnospiraceae bacterium]